jgi:hypothetical protein
MVMSEQAKVHMIQGSGSPSPLQEIPVTIPAAVINYFSGVPSGLGKVDIASCESPAQIEQFRGLGDLLLAEGWSGLEGWGVWSDGTLAILYFRNAFGKNAAFPPPDNFPELIINARGAVSESHPNLSVRFTLGTVRKEFVFVWPEVTAQINLPVPADCASEPILRLVLEIEVPQSPYEQTKGVSPDRRKTGIGVRSIEIRPAASMNGPSPEGLVQSKVSIPTNDPPSGDPPVPPAAAGLIASWPKPAVRVVAMTMVYNEGDMLRRWLAHYGRHLGEHSLIIIDHGSDDGSTDHIGAAGRITLPRGPFDDGQRADFVSGLQENLLQYYDAVIYTDCDEFLVPDPRSFSSLADYVEKMTVDCVRAVGVNLFHIRDREEPLRADAGFLDQRSYCQFYSPECKPVVTRTPMIWQAGFHACNKKALLDPGLLLIHAKMADSASALARLAVTRKIPWSERALRASWGVHHRAGDETLIGSFDTHERFLRRGGDIDTLCPKALAERINAQIEASSNPFLCESFVGPLCRVPEWLRGAV